MDREKWQEKKIAIKNLYLDNQNPRFPDEFSHADQKELIKELIEEEKILSLAKEIVNKQNYPQWEKVFVIKEKEQYVVIEGNRRLAAFKCLISPQLTPEKNRKQFIELSKQIKFDKNKRLEVIIAPNRETARPLIRTRHTKPEAGIKTWTVRQKTLFDSRKKPKTKQKLKGVERERAIQANFLKYLNRLDLPLNVKRIVKNHRKFSITNLMRMANSLPGRSYLEYKITEQGEIQPKNEKKFLAKLTPIVIDVAMEKVNSRKWASIKERKEEYLKKITNLKQSLWEKEQNSDKPPRERPKETEKKKLPEEETIKLPLPNIRYIPRKYNDPQVDEIIESTCLRFPEVVKQFKEKTKANHDLTMKTEYDVQYLLQGILRLWFNDIRLEEWTPSGLGGSRKIDIFIFKKRLAIETKIVYKKTTAKNLEKALINDIAGFKTHPQVEKVFFYIYDPVGLSNSERMRNNIDQLAKHEKKIKIKLIVSP